MNRYTQLTPSQFNPLSRDEIFMVPLARQRKHDQVQSQLDELGIFDINRLEADDATAKDYIDQYRSKVEGQADSILKSGVNNQSIREVRKLLSDKNKFMSNDGVGGKIQANYKAYQDYKTQLDEMKDKGKLGVDRYNALLNQATKDYQGVVNDGKLNLESAAASVDVADKLRPYMKDIMSNPTKIEENTGYRLNPTTGMFINVKTGKSTTPDGIFRIAANNLAKNDPEIMSYLTQRERLGMGNADSVLSNLGNTFEGMYSVGEYSEDISSKFMPQWMVDLKNKDGIDPNNLPYELGGVEELIIENESLSNSLNDIITGRAKELPKGEFVNNSMGMIVGQNPTSNVASKIEDLTEKQQRDYNYIFEGLKDSKIIPSNVKKNSPEANIAIKNYLDENKSITFQPKLLTNGLYKTYDTSGSKIKKSTPSDIAQGIALNPDKRTYIDNETKKVLSYKDMQDKYGDELQEMLNNSKVSGVYSPDNYLADQIQDPANIESLTSPYELQFKDGTKFLVSRSEYEKRQPSYVADTKYNEIWRNTSKRPNIPYAVDIPFNTKDAVTSKITRLKDGSFILNTFNKEGDKTRSLPIENEQHLQNTINNVYIK